MTATASLTASPALRVRALGRLHALKRDLALDDDMYRDMLEARTGKRSAAELSMSEIAAVIAHLGRSGSAKRTVPATPQGKMLQGLWMSLFNLALVDDKSDAALMAFVKRQTGIVRAEWLRSQGDVEKVAEALKAWLARDAGVSFRPRRGEPPFMRLPSYRVCEAQWNLLCRALVQPAEGLIAFAASVHAGKGVTPELFTNPHWGHVSRKLGYLVRQHRTIIFKKGTTP
jgi:hypothetical protein